MLFDELHEKLAKRIEGRLVEKDRDRKSQKDDFNNNKVSDQVFDKPTTMTISAIKFLERDIKNIASSFYKEPLTVENPIDILTRIIK
jgi:serine/threonine-protein kinase RIO1